MRERAREPDPARTKERTLSGLVLVLLFVASGALVWLVSTDDQRADYLSLLGIATERDRSSQPQQSQVSHQPAPSGFADALPVQRQPWVSHTVVGSPCSRTIANPTKRVQGAVYQWTDEAGQTHFSDRPPPTGTAKVVGHTAEDGVGMFSVDYRYVGIRPTTELRDALQRDIAGVFRVLARELELSGAAPLHVNLTIIRGARAFAAYQKEKTRTVSTNSGYYSYSDNEAVVRWVDFDRTLAVARHEVSHLALGNWLGVTPLWLNEGLAEIMETLTFKESYASGSPPEGRLGYVRELERTGKLPPLRAFLSSERGEWRRLGDAVSYSFGWSLVQFLLEEPSRREVLIRYMNALAERRCTVFDAVGLLGDVYPGGLERFEAEWRRWLRRGAARQLHL